MDILSFNGKTYNNLEEMPADQRAAYEQVMAFMKDENNNGIPDMFEGDVIQKMIGLAANTRIIVNGQEKQGLEALPPEVRAKFDKAMQKLSQLGILPTGTQGTQETAFQPSSQSTPQIGAKRTRVHEIAFSHPVDIVRDLGGHRLADWRHPACRPRYFGLVRPGCRRGIPNPESITQPNQ